MLCVAVGTRICTLNYLGNTRVDGSKPGKLSERAANTSVILGLDQKSGFDASHFVTAFGFSERDT